MLRKNFINKILVGCIILAFFSCDKDFNTLGGDVIGDDHFDLTAYRDASVVAFNQRVGVVQTNNLEINPLGVFNNSVFGKTTAQFVTQLELNFFNLSPTFGTNLEVIKVELNVPYFSTLISTDEDGASTYKLDSIYGNVQSKMKLSVYENGYFLRDLDPDGGFSEPQKYFSDQSLDFDSNSIGTRLNDSSETSQNEEFFFNPSEIVVTTFDDEGNPTTTRSAPAMKLELNRLFFKNKIFSSAGAGNMVNNNIFKNYFRGLYFKIEEIPGESNALAMLNFKQGKISITYKEDQEGSDGTITQIEKNLDLNLVGNTVSLQEFSNVNPLYENALNTSNAILGDPALYIKGGVGSMAVIDLFGPDTDNNGIADELELIRSNGWLINEANLVFHIDQEALGTSVPEPDRIYLYDIQNKRPLLDYYTDLSTNSSKAKYGKFVHGGIIRKPSSDGRGTEYKIRITNHIANLIRKDSTNVRLGLVVTEDYRRILNAGIKLPQPEATVDRVPVGSVLSPLGTVLYGNHSSVPADKRLRLEIFYTKPN